ncbi:MAG: hypothetical protein J6Z25_03515 [Opitutales bacterium]|nr:hypothetical protein [Opitutales bacterium]
MLSKQNCFANIVPGIVALPLAMAFAIASSVSPEKGLYTAIVAGFLVSVFGGTRVQIAGPTGAFVILLSRIVQEHGFEGLQLATFLAGIFLVFMGVLKLGSMIQYIPEPVTIGFTSGIALTIFVGQWKDFFGLSEPLSGSHVCAKIFYVFQTHPAIDQNTTLLVGSESCDHFPHEPLQQANPWLFSCIGRSHSFTLRFPISIGSDHWKRFWRNSANVVLLPLPYLFLGIVSRNDWTRLYHRLIGSDRIVTFCIGCW